MKKINFLFLACAALTFSACSDDEPNNPDNEKTEAVEGLYIVNEGSYMTPSASLSLIDTENFTVSNEIFKNANGYILGDVAQSMSIVDGNGWICVNNSNIVYSIDLNTNKELGRVTDVTSPRYATQVAADKVYISQMYSDQITVVDPRSYRVTGHITVPMKNTALNNGSTEQIIHVGEYAYVNCWSYQREVVKIDVATDRVVASLDMGVQPKAMAYDGRSTLWVLIDGGGWDANPSGYEAPSIAAIDLKSFTVTRRIELPMGTVSHLCYYDGALYWLQNGVQRMSDTATDAPSAAFIPSDSWSLYGLTVNPANGDIYVADAIDYTQNGVVTRYDNSGNLTNNFNVGICPASFCWRTTVK